MINEDCSADQAYFMVRQLTQEAQLAVLIRDSLALTLEASAIFDTLGKYKMPHQVGRYDRGPTEPVLITRSGG